MPVLPVKAITQDGRNLKTYVFEHNLMIKPGQFVMVWMPGVDEVPMSVGWKTDTEFHVGIAAVGDCTQVIFDQIKVGDKLGIRGPYGSSFSYEPYEQVIMVGGGSGTPPMLNLAQKTRAKEVPTTVILGGRSQDFLLYEDEFESIGCELMVSTDDGSKGHKGYCTDLFEEKMAALDLSKKTCVYTCGPEVMMLKVIKSAQEKGIDCQAALERYMKCGFGVCGQCCMDDSGLRVCKEGPVIDGKLALEQTEFGKYKRASSGKVISY